MNKKKIEKDTKNLKGKTANAKAKEIQTTIIKKTMYKKRFVGFIIYLIRDFIGCILLLGMSIREPSTWMIILLLLSIVLFEGYRLLKDWKKIKGMDYEDLI